MPRDENMPTNLTFAARFDSNSANNAALNLTGAPAVTITFAPESITGAPGDILLEGSEGNPDPDTVVYIGGVAYEFSFTISGTLPTQNSQGANQVPGPFQGSDVYVITIYDYPTAGSTSRLAYMPNEEATLADMDAFGNGAINVQNTVNNPPPAPVCFCAGTEIETPDGPVTVENLKIGDQVCTRDGTLRVIWIGLSDHRWSAEADDAKPFVVPSNAFGPGLPYRDLHISPQHKLALTETKDNGGSEIVLCPVKGLAGWRGIRQRQGCRATSYFHVLLERHAVVRANGLETESFFPGKTALRMLSAQSRRDLLNLLVGTTVMCNLEEVYGAQAARSLNRRESLERRDLLHASNADEADYRMAI
jgi:hypothetical protein